MYVHRNSVYEDNDRKLANFSSNRIALMMQGRFDGIWKNQPDDPIPTASDLETERRVWQLLEMRKGTKT